VATMGDRIKVTHVLPRKDLFMGQVVLGTTMHSTTQVY